MISAVVSDFGGVLTTPLFEAFTRAHEQAGITVDALRRAMGVLAAGEEEPPLFRLERGEIAEPEFLDALAAALEQVLGHPVSLDGYGARLMRAMRPNEPLLDYYRSLRERGVRLAILTNNVREWEAHWRALVPVDELFELVVDSAFVGMRKPEPGIYALTLERLGLPGRACAFVDDLEVNLPPAREAGMHAIHFRSTEQAIAELDALVV